MSLKLSKRLSSKKKKPPKDNAQPEVLSKLGLEAFGPTPLDPASMLDISAWTLENQPALEPKDLPRSFLHRLWLLSPDARSSCCNPAHDAPDSANKPAEEMINVGGGGEGQCSVNPLDLVTAVFMSANNFLQQEMTVRMVQCQFAVPLVLPSLDAEEPSNFLLWPSRGVVSQWRSHFRDTSEKVQEGFLASTCMPMVSCVKLDYCSVSKSQVLNNVIGGPRSCSETFLHRGVDGGQLPRRLSNGLVEIGLCLPTGDTDSDMFPVPVVLSNLRGDASLHEKCLSLLCVASSAVVVFCGNLGEKEKQLLASCKDKARKLILIDLSQTDNDENGVEGFVGQNLEDAVGLPEGSVLQGRDLNEEDLANLLRNTLKDLLTDQLQLVTLEATAKLALELGFNVDEGLVCKKAMATVEGVLKGLDEGSAQFRQKQLPLQGASWQKLAEIEKKEAKQRKEGKETDPQLQREKKNILVKLRSYKMTPTMKLFTDALFTADIVERTYFLSWMRLRLRMLQMEKQNSPQDQSTYQQTEEEDRMSNHSVLENGDNSEEESDSFFTDTTLEEERSGEDLNDDLQQLGIGQENMSTEKSTQPEQQLNIRSEGEETHSEEILENNICSEEHISGPVVKEQSLQLESGTLSFQGEELGEPKLPLDRSRVTSSAKQHMCLYYSFGDQAATCSQPFESDQSSLGLEHFLREMSLIFELTHITPGSGSHNVLRLPSIAADLILYGVPLELMDGDASNIPVRWLGCVLAEVKRRLPQEQFRTRILTSFGMHHAKNAEVLSALFGVKFPEGRERSTRGVYMVVLCLPTYLREDMECDFLLLIDVEGIRSTPTDNKINTLIHDNEMATVAAGISDVLMQNISPHVGSEFEANLTLTVNALLRIKECGYMPTCQILTHDERLYSILQATQLRRISDILQTKTEERESSNTGSNYAKNTSCITCVKGPWYNMLPSKSVDMQHSTTVLKLKQNLFGALKNCAAQSASSGLPEFMGRLCAVWEAVKSESFSIGLQNTDVALAFSKLSTEDSQWEDSLLEHMENWLMGVSEKIHNTEAKGLIQDDPLTQLKDEAAEEVRAEVNKHRPSVEANLMEAEHLKMHASIFKPILMSNLDNIQRRVTEEVIQRLDALTEDHGVSSQLKNFEALLKKEQESRLHALVENSRSTKCLFQDTELEDEFEGVWKNTLSNFDFRPSETDDITARVTNILGQNIISRGFLKHVNKLEVIGQNQTTAFHVHDEHFGYRSRMKHVFEDNSRLQRVEAEQLANDIIEQYNQFAEDKSGLLADFSDSYITELLENVEKALSEKSLEIKSAYEVDLKVYLCSAACRDFQILHDRYAKDGELLTQINASKSTYLAAFIYKFRKMDQCQRLAQTFISMVVKPTVLDNIYRPFGVKIMEEIRGKGQQFLSRQAFHRSLLEELIKEDRFESFIEYLLCYDSFRLRKIQEMVTSHLSESTGFGRWRQHRLGEIVGKFASAVSEMADGTNGVLSDTKPLLERVCLTVEIDGDVNVIWDSLSGPLFSITTDWNHFIKHLMELLAAMRLELTQEFSQNADIDQLLQCLPIHPADLLLKRVSGCDKQCPVCRAPCEVEEIGHEVHRAVLHRPKNMLPSCTSSPEHMSNDLQSLDTQDIYMACREVHDLYPDWSISPEDPSCQTPSVYWRYVLARFNERFAKEYEQPPAKIPEDWKTITEEEAVDSLKDTFLLNGHS